MQIDFNSPKFLNHARSGLWLAQAWFLKTDPMGIVGMHVSVSAPKVNNN